MGFGATLNTISEYRGRQLYFARKSDYPEKITSIKFTELTFPIVGIKLSTVVLITSTRIPDPPFSSFGPSRDYGMDLSLEVYL